MSEGHFEPLHDAHAIEQVILGVQFDNPLNDTAYERSRIGALQTEHEDLRSLLPRFSEEPGFEVRLDPTVANTAPQLVPGIAAFLFDRIRPDGTPGIQLRIDRQSVAFRTLQYTRWEAVRREAWLALQPAMNLFLNEGRSLVSVMLHYADRFVWQGQAADMRASALLQPHSPWIAPIVYQAAEFWHSHSGQFQRIEGGRIRRLVNVNLDAQEYSIPPASEMHRAVSVQVSLTDAVNQPTYEQTHMASEETSDWVKSRLEELHAVNKAIVAEVISDEMARRISLGVQ